jgi:hypothetical protein
MLPVRPPAAWPDCHGKEGVAGSSPAEGFENLVVARFSCLRSGSVDHFRCRGEGVAGPGPGTGIPRNRCHSPRYAAMRSDRSSFLTLSRVPSGRHFVAAGRVSSRSTGRERCVVSHLPARLSISSRAVLATPSNFGVAAGSHTSMKARQLSSREATARRRGKSTDTSGSTRRGRHGLRDGKMRVP